MWYQPATTLETARSPRCSAVGTHAASGGGVRLVFAGHRDALTLTSDIATVWSRGGRDPVLVLGDLLSNIGRARELASSLLSKGTGARIHLEASPAEILAFSSADLALLSAAGVVVITLLTESGSDALLSLRGRSHRAGDALAASGVLVDHGIVPSHRILVGLKDETVQDWAQTLSLLRRLRGAARVSFEFEGVEGGRLHPLELETRCLQLALACEARCPDRSFTMRMLHRVAFLRLTFGFWRWPIELRWAPPVLRARAPSRPVGAQHP